MHRGDDKRGQATFLLSSCPEGGIADVLVKDGGLAVATVQHVTGVVSTGTAPFSSICSARLKPILPRLLGSA